MTQASSGSGGAGAVSRVAHGTIRAILTIPPSPRPSTSTAKESRSSETPLSRTKLQRPSDDFVEPWLETGYEPLWPRNETELRARFEKDGFDPEEIPEGDQARLLLNLLELYAKEDKGLAPATRPLCECCPSHEPCWAGIEDARRTPRSDRREDGGIILPWVGARYQPGGLVVLAINPNIAPDHRTFLLSEHEISWRHHCVLEDDQKSDEGSSFAYRMLRSAAALLDWADKLPISDRERPQDLVDALHRTSRLQAVKCVPRRHRSKPTSAMEHACPTFLMEDELGILRPRVILALGNVADDAVSRLSGYQDLESASSEFLWRDRLAANWGSAEVFAIPHPAALGGRWQRGHDELLAALRGQTPPC